MDKFIETIDLFLVERFDILPETDNKSTIITKIKNELDEDNLKLYGDKLDQASKLYETLDVVINELDEQFLNFITSNLTNK